MMIPEAVGLGPEAKTVQKLTEGAMKLLGKGAEKEVVHSVEGATEHEIEKGAEKNSLTGKKPKNEAQDTHIEKPAEKPSGDAANYENSSKLQNKSPEEKTPGEDRTNNSSNEIKGKGEPEGDNAGNNGSIKGSDALRDEILTRGAECKKGGK